MSVLQKGFNQTHVFFMFETKLIICPYLFNFKVKIKKRWSQVMYMSYILQKEKNGMFESDKMVVP